MKVRLDRLKGSKPLPLGRQIRLAGLKLEEDSSQEATWNFISLLQRAVSEQLMLYVPRISAQSTDLNQIDPLDLQIYVLPEKELYRKVEMEQGGLAYCAFLEPVPIDEGPPAEYSQVPAGEIFRAALDDPEVTGLILDPWNLSALLNHDLLSLILNEDGQSASCSLYINCGEAADQDADVLVSIARHPFDEHEPGPKAVFDRAGDPLRKICSQLEPPEPGEIVVTSSGIGSSSAIFHTALPEEINEDTLRVLLDTIMTRALNMGYTSVALPALGNEEARVEDEVPFAIIAIGGWICRHPECGMSVTISARHRETYDKFCKYMFEDGLDQMEFEHDEMEDDPEPPRLHTVRLDGK